MVFVRAPLPTGLESLRRNYVFEREHSFWRLLPSVFCFFAYNTVLTAEEEEEDEIEMEVEESGYNKNQENQTS